VSLTSVKTIKNLLQQRGSSPSRWLGQNFLVDRGAVGKIVKAAELTSSDTVLEIGPGLGVLTQELARIVKKVVAVEKDRNMVESLKETLRDHNNIEVIGGDILKFNFLNSKFEARNSKQIPNPNNQNPKQRLEHLDLENLNLFRISNLGFRAFKLVANLPYYIVAPTIRKFLETSVQPKLMVLVVQKEVGQRICAKPPDMNLLAVSVQFYAEPKIISYISKKSFWPSPKVDAAIIKITPKIQNIQTSGVCMFFKIVKAGFSQPRKQLINNLSRGLSMDKKKTGEWLLKNNISPAQRAETLSIEEWIELTKSFVSNSIETRP